MRCLPSDPGQNIHNIPSIRRMPTGRMPPCSFSPHGSSLPELIFPRTCYAPGLKCPSGLGFSADSTKFYLASACVGELWWYVYDVSEDGSLSNRRIFLVPATMQVSLGVCPRDRILWKLCCRFEGDSLLPIRSVSLCSFSLMPGVVRTLSGTLRNRTESVEHSPVNNGCGRIIPPPNMQWSNSMPVTRSQPMSMGINAFDPSYCRTVHGCRVRRSVT